VSFIKKAAMEAGMNGYVTKPIRVEALLREIRAIMQGQGDGCC
jgi:DNA-binding response OmpR family regulator